MLKHDLIRPFRSSAYGTEENYRLELASYCERELGLCAEVAGWLSDGGSLPRCLRSRLEDFIEDEDGDFDIDRCILHWESMARQVCALRDALAAELGSVLGWESI